MIEMIDEKCKEIEKRMWETLTYIEFDVLEIYDELEGEGIYREYIENKISDILEKTRLGKLKLKEYVKGDNNE